MPAMYRRYNIQLDTEKDADLIEYLDAQANQTETFREGLRRLMKEA